MSAGVFSGWSREQRNVVIASMLGWTLDAFDYFLLVFVLKDVAHEFNVPIAKVTFAITLIALLGREARGVTFGGVREPALAGARGGE